MIASCRFLGDGLRQFSKEEEGVTMADSVETLGVDLRTRVKNLRAKRKSGKKEVHSEILAYLAKQSLPEELHEGGSQEVGTGRHDASKNVASSCSWDGSLQKDLN